MPILSIAELVRRSGLKLSENKILGGGLVGKLDRMEKELTTEIWMYWLL
jgi:hypothetical protein